MIIEGVDRLYDAYCKFVMEKTKFQVKLTLKNGEVIIGAPFAVSQPEPDEMDLGYRLVFPGLTKNSTLRGYWNCEVETVELIEV